MALPNYYQPIVTDALNISGGSPESYSNLRDRYSKAITPPTYSPGSPKPIMRPEQEARQTLKNLNPLEYEFGNFAPYLQQAQQMAGIRTQEDLWKYQRDYRKLISGGSSGDSRQFISGTGDRLRGVSAQRPQFSASAQSAAAPRISDPVTNSFRELSGVSY